MALLPGYEKELPPLYIKALNDKKLDAKNNIKKIHEPYRIQRKKGSSRKMEKKYFLEQGTVQAVIEHCRTVDILDWVSQHNTPIARNMGQLSNVIQSSAATVLRPLAQKAGSYLSKAHLLCDITAALLQTLIEENIKFSISNLEEFTSHCIEKYEDARKSSFGNGPSMNNRTNPAKTISRYQLDKVQMATRYDDGDSLSPSIIEKLITEIVKNVLNAQITPELMDSLSFSLQIASILFCSNPSEHHIVWDTSFIPVFNSEVCVNLRASVSPEVLSVMKYAETDTWDDGSSSKWITPYS